MKKIMLPLATILLFCLATFAQDTSNTPNSTQGTQSASPSMQQDTQGNTGANGTTANNTEKKMKGCVAQENGQYVLETKHGKNIPLSGEDVSAHMGHTVEVHGMWASSSAGTATASGASAHTFDVTKVDMISDSCTMKGNTSTGSSGATPQQ